MNHLGKDTIRRAASNRDFSLFTLCCGQIARNLRDWRRCDKRLKEQRDGLHCPLPSRRRRRRANQYRESRLREFKASLAARLMFAKDERPSKSWSQP
jgi:hypothetical protein